MDRKHAPLWIMPEVVCFKNYANCREVSFPQCAFGAAYNKMTTLLLTPALGHLLGDLGSLKCVHAHHDQRAGGERDANGVTWNSKASAAAYPPDLNFSIAGAINALIDDPAIRNDRGFRLNHTGEAEIQNKTLPPMNNIVHSSPPANTPQPLIELCVPPEPRRSANTLPYAEPTLTDAAATPTANVIPPELPDLPSSRTRSKTASITLAHQAHSPAVGLQNRMG